VPGEQVVGSERGRAVTRLGNAHAQHRRRMYSPDHRRGVQRYRFSSGVRGRRDGKRLLSARGQIPHAGLRRVAEPEWCLTAVALGAGSSRGQWWAGPGVARPRDPFQITSHSFSVGARSQATGGREFRREQRGTPPAARPRSRQRRPGRKTTRESARPGAGTAGSFRAPSRTP